MKTTCRLGFCLVSSFNEATLPHKPSCLVAEKAQQQINPLESDLGRNFERILEVKEKPDVNLVIKSQTMVRNGDLGGNSVVLVSE
jgi:hypothetical protein